MTEKTDYELLNGNSDDFTELYTKYSRSVESFLYLYKLVRNPSDNDDILQLVWIRVHINKNKYDPQWAFSTWISRVSLHVVLNFYRDRETLPFATGDKNLEYTIDPREERDTLVVEETVTRVRKAIERLPANAKEAIEKVYFSNLRFATGAYHQGYKRGRRLLKSSLGKLNNELSAT